MRNRCSIAALALILTGLSGPSAHAQSSDGFPFSIINDGSERRAANRAKKAPPQARPDAQLRAQPRRGARRGSSTAATIPTYRSPLTPLGTVRPMPTAPSMANPSSPATIVPGVGGVAGTPAIAPARPAGQSFQDRATNCVASGSAQGVGRRPYRTLHPELRESLISRPDRRVRLTAALTCNRMVACHAHEEPRPVFKALADESRRRLLDRLRNRNGQTLGELCSGHDMTRQAVSKHLSILEQANLVVTVKRGREKFHYLNPDADPCDSGTLDRKIRWPTFAGAQRVEGQFGEAR